MMSQRLKRVSSYDGTDVWMCILCSRKADECLCEVSEAKMAEAERMDRLRVVRDTFRDWAKNHHWKDAAADADILQWAIDRLCLCAGTDRVEDTREERDIHQLRREMVGHRTFIEKRDAETIKRVAQLEEHVACLQQKLTATVPEKFNVPYGVAGTSDRGPMVDAGIKECAQAAEDMAGYIRAGLQEPECSGSDPCPAHPGVRHYTAAKSSESAANAFLADGLRERSRTVTGDRLRLEVLAFLLEIGVQADLWQLDEIVRKVAECDRRS